MKNILFLFIALMFCSCTSGTALLTGTRRPATDPNSVRILPEYPAEYEIIGLVTATSDAGGDAQGDIDLARDEIRKQAASLGANAVVLEGTKEDVEYVYTSGGMLIPSTSHTISGKALYVSDFTPKRTARSSNHCKKKMPPPEVESSAPKMPARVINVAIMETVSNGVTQPDENQYITNVLREVAIKTLPFRSGFNVMTRDDILSKVPSEVNVEDCEGKCLVQVGKAIGSDYIAQAKISSIGEKIVIFIELYQSLTSQLVSSFNAKTFNVDQLEAEIRSRISSFYNVTQQIEYGE